MKFKNKIVVAAVGALLAIGSGIGIANAVKAKDSMKVTSDNYMVTRGEPSSNGSWELVTNAGDLMDGDKIVLACKSKEAINGAANETYLNAITGIEFGENDIISAVPTSSEITLSKDVEDNFTLTIGGNIISTDANKKLKFDNESGVSTWTIEIDDSNNATIASTTTTYGKFLFNNQSNPKRFLNYSSVPTAQNLLPQIYKFVSDDDDGLTAQEVAQVIKEMAGNSWSNHVSTDSCYYNYSLAKEFVSQLGDTELNIFLTSTNIDIANARATYEHWCEVNNDSNPYSGSAVPANKGLVSIDSSSKNIILLILIVFAYPGIIAGVFFLKKRKHQ